MRSIFLVPCIAVAAHASALFAQAAEPLVVPRLSGQIRVDGVVDEPEWEAIPPLPMTMTRPTFGGVPTERTEVRIAHDDHFLYVSGRLYDSDPSRLQASSLERDDMDLSNDFLGVVLDTFDDGENALAFFTTPAGIRVDFAIHGDAQDAFPANVGWNAVWDAEVSRSEEGWFAELRIPFSSLRFQDDSGRVTMGLIVWRSVARRNEYVIFPAITQRWGFWGMNKPSQAHTVVMEGVHRRTPLHVSPYVLGGHARSARLGADRATYEQTGGPAREVGLDVKYGMASNLTLDITVNTDFAQAEVDEPQLNLTRYALFLPERRQFFQERAGVFDFRTEGVDRLFHSRRVGLSSAGEPLRIHGGGRLVGRVSAWDLGIMSMHVEAEDSSGTEHLGVARVRRQLLRSGSHVGGMITSRTGSGGRYNVAYGADAQLRLFRRDLVSLHWARSLADTIGRDADATLASVQWERRTREGFAYELGASRIGASYEPGLGFVRRRDYTRAAARLGHGWRRSREARLAGQTLAIRSEVVLRNADRATETLRSGIDYVVETRRAARLELSGQSSREELDRPFPLSRSVHVPAGSYRFHELSGTLHTGPGALFRTGLLAGGGEFYDGWRVRAGISPTWKLSPRFELGGSYEHTRLGFPDRDQELLANIAQLRAQAAFDVRTSAAVFVQYNDAASSVGVHARLRHNRGEGEDLYLVYDEGFNLDRHDFDPARPRSARRALLVKYSRLFSPTIVRR